MRPARYVLRLLSVSLLGFAGLTALAAEPITGTVTNGTNGKASAGDLVTLIQLQQGMNESSHTTTDARGRFSLDVPDDGIHLIRVTHEKAAYFQPVQPDTHTVAITVYDAAPNIPGVRTNVEELHVEATPTELHVVEVLQVLNDSAPPRTQFGPKGYEFYLPKGSLVGRTGAITQGGMPVQTPAVPLSDPGHYTFLFPIRPGETQFGISYTVPYTGKFTFTPRLPGAVKTFAVLLPSSMSLTPGSRSGLTLQAPKPGSQTYIAQDVAADQPVEFTVTGTGAMPEPAAGGDGAGAGPNASTANPGPNSDANAPTVSNSELAGGRGLNNPLDESGDRDPWAKYKWWILSGLALLLAGAAGILLRKPSGLAPGGAVAPDGNPWAPVPAPRPAASDPGDAIFAALKEEMFSLETERLQRRITEPEYRQLRGAMELILGRVLNRRSGSSADLTGTTPLATATTATEDSEPALTGHHDA